MTRPSPAQSTPADGAVAGLPAVDAATAADRLRPLLPPRLAAIFGAAFIRSSALYDEFVYRLTLQVVCDVGLEPALREPRTVAEIVVRAGLSPERASTALTWLLSQLVAHGHVDAVPAPGQPTRFRVRGALPALDPAFVLDAQRRHDPSWLPSYTLAEAAAGDYSAFLHGTATGEELLFSASRLRLWIDYFSNDNGLYAVNNRVGAVALSEWLPQRSPAVILEIGGGLASGAVALLDELQDAGRLPEVAQYRFTEIVPAFLRRGQRALESRFGGSAALTFACLDMNRPFHDQGLDAEGVSVVYAVNTLHVAHDLEFTLREIFRALEPGGRLIISECIRPFPGQPIYVEFVFNLMEAFRSARLHPTHRPNGGFLTPEQWAGGLAAAGFTDIRLLPRIERIRDQFPAFFVAAIGATRPA